MSAVPPASSAPTDPASPAARGQQVRSLSLLSVLLLLVVAVLLNVVVARASSRVDLTEEGLYTLGDGTKKLLKSLPDPATIRVFWGGLEARSELVRRKYEALLDEMADASDGKLSVRWVDVSGDEGKEEAREAGVQKYMFRQRVGDHPDGQSGRRVAAGANRIARQDDAADRQIRAVPSTTCGGGVVACCLRDYGSGSGCAARVQ